MMLCCLVLSTAAGWIVKKVDSDNDEPGGEERDSAKTQILAIIDKFWRYISAPTILSLSK